MMAPDIMEHVKHINQTLADLADALDVITKASQNGDMMFGHQPRSIEFKTLHVFTAQMRVNIFAAELVGLIQLLIPTAEKFNAANPTVPVKLEVSDENRSPRS